MFSFPSQSPIDKFCKSEPPRSLKRLSRGLSQMERKEISKSFFSFLVHFNPQFAHLYESQNAILASVREGTKNFMCISLKGMSFSLTSILNQFLWSILERIYSFTAFSIQWSNFQTFTKSLSQVQVLKSLSPKHAQPKIQESVKATISLCVLFS